MADSRTKTTSATTTDPSVFGEIWRSLQLVYYLVLDPRVPFLYKLIIPAVIIYVLSPLDVIPDAFIIMLGLGALDDLAVMFLGIKLFIHMCPPDVVMEYRARLAGGRAAPTADDSNTVEGTYRVVEEKH